MTSTTRKLGCLLAVALLATGAACERHEVTGGPGDTSATAPGQTVAEPRLVSQSEAMALLESDAPPLILDVRTQEEYDTGHVPGAVLVPHSQLPERLDEVLANRERLIVVYCESGRRAAKAIDVLQKAGVEHVAELEGDMRAWRDAGLPQEH